ncbi:hypothetical protein L484_019110 [Morus notabilis]|uniref:Uncharacterized protein n=1 Tax=Morus notabilis TaxID=981085 RepID=W9SBC4_9ROSA|nr:hypothetical protein L484_019110 [Morus notabilis]
MGTFVAVFLSLAVNVMGTLVPKRQARVKSQTKSPPLKAMNMKAKTTNRGDDIDNENDDRRRRRRRSDGVVSFGRSRGISLIWGLGQNLRNRNGRLSETAAWDHKKNGVRRICLGSHKEDHWPSPQFVRGRSFDGEERADKER